MTEKRSRRRGKGSLTPYKVKAGERWMFQIYVPVDPENPELGEKRLTRGGFKTHDEADDAMQIAIAKRRNEENFHSTVPTMKQYGQDWVDSLNLQRSTLVGYQRQFDLYIAPALGNKPIDKITAPAIGRFYKELRASGGKDGAPLSANTVNKTSITLAAILDVAVDEGFITRNPARIKKTVKAPTAKDIRAEKSEITTWSAAQLHAFLEWNKDVLQDDLHPLWRTMAFTGLRRSEALALKWGDINFQTQQLSLRRAVDTTQRNVTKPTKTGSSRSIDLDKGTVEILKSYKSTRGLIALDLARPEAYIFSNLEGMIRSPNEVGRRWSYRVKRAREALQDLPKITLHELRHTHATVLLELGQHPKIVQERLGHSTISTTMNIYSHVTQSMQRTAIDRLAQHVESS